METNDVMRQVIQSIKDDLLRNTDFLSEVLANYQLKEDNIPASTIIKLMALFSKGEAAPVPQSNSPKDRSSRLARPIAIGTQEANIISDLLEGNNVFLMGKAGTGKTYLAKALSEGVMNQPVFVINCSQWTSPIEIRGGQTIEGYKEGELIKAWAEGGIVILDELPKLDPNTAGLLNDALAETAAQPKYDEQNPPKVIPDTIPYITNGAGVKVYKGQNVTAEKLEAQWNKMDDKTKGRYKDKEEFMKIRMDAKFRFAVIGTGNTDMMTVGNKYGGNQKQDYSLVDRFAGSYYQLEKDVIKEKELNYSFVFNVCDAIRNFLESTDAPQSISLRTMLNFNRTFEQEMLYEIDPNSPFTDKIINNRGMRMKPKTIADSIQSFCLLLEDKGDALKRYPQFVQATGGFTSELGTMARLGKRPSASEFKKEFVNKYKLDPKTGVPSEVNDKGEIVALQVSKKK